MAKWNRLLQPCMFFFTTVAARGARDGITERPREEDFTTLSTRQKLAPHEHVLVGYTETEIDKIEGRLGKAKAKAVSHALRCRYFLAPRLEAFKKALSDHRALGFREPHPVIPHLLYISGMLVVGLAEYVFNLFAFELLDVDDIEKILIAAGLGLATPLTAHIFGTALRHSSKNWRTISIVALMIASTLAGVYSVAWIRQQFLIEQAKSSGAALPEGGQWLLLALLGVNLFIFVFSVGLAFFAHDPDRELERVWRELTYSRKRVTRAWKSWTKYAVRFNKKVAGAIAEMEALKDSCITAIAEYRDHNIRNREDSGPTWFRVAVPRQIFRNRNLGALIEQQPPPINELLEPTERERRIVPEAENPGRGNGEDKTADSRLLMKGDNHAAL